MSVGSAITSTFPECIEFSYRANKVTCGNSFIEVADVPLKGATEVHLGGLFRFRNKKHCHLENTDPEYESRERPV